ncbi:hypothetical protein, partial [Actinomyces minihominis]|uniref:hypothetical protein n=1 Tax=Actinomyces minihominis TaxID=2002838 RepID=UPI001A92F6AA
PNMQATNFNPDFAAPSQRKLNPTATQTVRPSSWQPPTSTPTLPHHHKHNPTREQHQLSYKP